MVPLYCCCCGGCCVCVWVLLLKNAAVVAVAVVEVEGRQAGPQDVAGRAGFVTRTQVGPQLPAKFHFSSSVAAVEGGGGWG